MFFGMIVYYVHIALQWFSTSTPSFWYDCILDGTEFQKFSSMCILYFVGWLSTWLYGMSRFSSTFVLYFVVWLSTIHKTCQRFSTVTFHFVVWLSTIHKTCQRFSTVTFHFVVWLSTIHKTCQRFSTVTFHFVVWLSTIHKTCQRFSTVTFHFVVWLYHTQDMSKVFYSYLSFCSMTLPYTRHVKGFLQLPFIL